MNAAVGDALSSLTIIFKLTYNERKQVYTVVNYNTEKDTKQIKH